MVLTGDQAGAEFGASLSCAGDVDGDGDADVIIGAPRHTNTAMNEGRASLFLGSTGGPVPSDWTVHGFFAELRLGTAVSGAGDVNGDGYADLLTGAPVDADATTFGGRAYAYYGNSGDDLHPGVSLRPRQERVDAPLPIAARGVSPFDAFGIALLGRTPFGRSGVKLHWEVHELGSSVPLASGITPDWVDTGTAGADLSATTPFFSDGVYRWRARLLYDAARTPFASAGRWIRVPWDGGREADLRVEKMPAVLSLDDATPIDVIHATDDPAPESVARHVSNIGTAGLEWSAAAAPPSSWLTVTAASGSGLLASDPPTPVAIAFDAALPLGLHTTTLRFTNEHSATNFVDVPVSLAVVGPLFFPGDRLEGVFDDVGDSTEARFDAIEGMKLRLKLEKSTTPMKIGATVFDDLGEKVETVILKSGAKTKKQVKLARSGTHTVRLTLLGGPPGALELETNRVLPQKGTKHKKTKHGSKSDPGTAEFAIQGLPGAELSVKFLPKSGFTGPMGLGVTQPDGQTLSATAQSLSNGGLSVEGLLFLQAGEMTFEVTGFAKKKEKVKAVYHLIQPQHGKSTVTLP